MYKTVKKCLKKNLGIMVEYINNRRPDIALDSFSQQFYFYL